jgi:LPXTG-motif cell wall-anchored protein
MNNVTLIQLAAGALFAVLLGILFRRRSSRVA